MKFIRIILLPIVPIYFGVTWLINLMYDRGILHSKSYHVPLICVGNLSTGGTGKTPMIEYLIRLLQGDKLIATLSRGYKRKTEGFVLANDNSNAKSIGDEPFQFYRKFIDIRVAVDANRQNGIAQLTNLDEEPNIILLDDAYQHRRVKADINILLTSYSNPYFKDMVLPTGNLREPKSGAKRADIIVVTKCPVDLKQEEKAQFTKRLKPKSYQTVFFSHIAYEDAVISNTKTLNLLQLPKFTLVTGIANAGPLVDYLSALGLSFDHLEFPDHYSFRPSDIEVFSEKDLVITTEKDFVRLSDNPGLETNLFYLPISLNIDNAHEFEELIVGLLAKKA